MTVSKLRARASRISREQHALFALLQQTTLEEFATFQRNEEFIRSGSEVKLRSFIARVSAQNAMVRKQLGLKSSEDLDALFSDIADAPKGTILYFTKGYLVMLCRNYEAVIPDIARLPSHARIGIEDGAHRTQTGRYRIFYSELQKFQDLAALHNEAKRRWDAVQGGTTYTAADAETRKTLDAICRQAIVAAYQVVEAYLNGLAFDFLAHPTHAFTRAEETLLKEQNQDGRTVFASFRKKVLHYPRIVKGAGSPLLDEATCPEVKFLLDSPKSVRDAIVHASPRNEVVEREPGKGTMIGDVDFGDLLEVTKNMVGLLRKTEKAICGDDSRLWWLEDVGADDRFRTSVFD